MSNERVGKYAVAYRKVDGEPWIGLPGVATNGTAEEMFAAARLDNWNVRKLEVVTDAFADSPDYEIVRDHPDGGTHRLAMSKGRYSEYQNESVLSFAKTLAHGDVTPVAMGSLNNGRKVFMGFQIGDTVTVKGTDDEVKTYLNLRTSHDGSWAFGTYVSNMRLACQNMLTSLKSSALSSFVIRHTDSLEGRVMDARTALGLSIKQRDLFLSDMEVLASQAMTDSKFWSLVKDIYPEPKADVRGSKAKWITKTDRIMGLWNGETVANLDKNAYRAYNALNEDLMWYSTVRAGNVENALMRSSGMDDAANKTNVTLYRRVLASA